MEYYCNILKGYSLYYDLPVSTNVGGVGFFIKNLISCKPRTDLKFKSNNSDLKIENMWFEINVDNSKYIIGGIYRHPNQNIEMFSNLLEVEMHL